MSSKRFSRFSKVAFLGQLRSRRHKLDILAKGDMGDRIVQTPHSNSSVEHAVDAYELSKTTVDPFERKENPQEISERILRLWQSLSNKVLVSRLPDQGEKIRKQISELEAGKFRLLAF
ncbi:hypothetical protein HPP92_000171 [Vanilla planifolia]|uniref:Uncharacterized protein n=1 Tax=Vanilla planifolia TaxID=51239 RepID=A0A835S2C7_VANPL|nr:hypothetical protein HPP92_000171 [Vanilla planifolia]